MMEWFLKHYRAPGLFNPAPCRRPLPRITIRPYLETDYRECVEIYERNEATRPLGARRREFEDHLRRQDAYWLVAEKDGKVVACGALDYATPDVAVLSHGHVHPDYHRRGVGTAMLMTFLAQLRAARNYCAVVIFSAPDSIEYFRRFGFEQAGWLDDQQDGYSSGRVMLSRRDINRCGTLLQKAGLSFPREPERVPFLQRNSYN